MQRACFFICLITSFCCIKAGNHYLTKEQAINWLREERITDTTQIVLGYDIIQRIDKNRIGYIDVFKLSVYFPNKKYFQHMSSHLFIANLMDEKKTLPENDYEQIVIMDRSVTKAYERNSLEDFIANYCKESLSGRRLIKSGLSRKTKLTVLYYLYQNDYFFNFDEYGGYYYFERIPLPIKLKDKTIVIKEDSDGIKMIEE